MTVRDLIAKLDYNIGEYIVRVRRKSGDTIVKFEPEHIDGIKDDILDGDIECFYVDNRAKNNCEIVMVLAGLPFEDDEDAD